MSKRRRSGRSAGQLLLVLVGDPVEFDLPAAIAAIRKRGFEHLIDFLGSRPVGPLAVAGARPSARPAGVARGLLARERGGLALCLASQLLDLALELGDSSVPPLPFGAQTGVLGFELVVSSYEAGELVAAGAGPVLNVAGGGMRHRSPRSPRLT